MYKKFSCDTERLQQIRSQSDSTLAASRWRSEVESRWRRIHARPSSACGQNSAKPANSTAARLKQKHERWRTVRLFISSTFKDFYAERERLVKRVMPRLRDFCSKRRVTLCECDLRWGVSSDSTGSDAVLTCMQQLDRCREEASSSTAAFFLCLLGDRFGWVPKEGELDDSLIQKYNWCSGCSVTQMEIVHGALDDRSCNALFMLRDPVSYDGMPDDLLKDFKESAGSQQEAEVAQQKLELLRCFPSEQLASYRLQFQGIKQEGRRVRCQFDGLDLFEDLVVKFFESAIAREFPEVAESDDSSLEDSNETHIDFMLSLTKFVSGQDRCHQLLLNYILQDELRTEDFKLYGDSNDHIAFGMPGVKTIIVAGEAGSGKTTALARVGEYFLDRPGFEVLVHFTQMTPASNDRRMLQKKIRSFLRSLLPENVAATFTDNSGISELLNPIMQLRKKVLILIDAFECFYEVSHVGELLPDVWPHNVKCIVSCRSKDLERCFSQRSVCLYNMEPLKSEDCSAICRRFFGEFGKQLDQQQLEQLIQKRQAANPLWLTEACEELRIFGDHSALTKKIFELPDDLKELMKSIAGRVVAENPDGRAATLLSLLCVSRIGLWEQYSRKLLQFAMSRIMKHNGNANESSPSIEDDGSLEEEEETPLADYLRLCRELRGFVHQIVRDSPALAFRHDVPRAAAQELLLSKPDSAKTFHSISADYILAVCQHRVDRLLSRDLPYHLYWCDRRLELHQLMNDMQSYRRLQLQLPQITCSLVYASWRCRLPKLTQTQEQSAQIIVCNFCSNLTSRMGVQRSGACLYCGCLLQLNRPGSFVPALTCNFHKAPHRNFLKCWYCDKIAPDGKQLFLCSYCNSNSNPNSCCRPVLDSDPQFAQTVRNQIKRFGLIW